MVSLSSRLLAVVLTPLLAAVVAVSVSCSSSEGDAAPRLEDPSATAAELVDRFARLVQQEDVEGLQGFLSEAFTILRADGSHRGKNDYIENLPEVGSYTITEVSAMQAGNALIVRWSLIVELTADGTRFSEEPAPRLSTFVYIDGAWRLSSHANFNPPVATE